MMKRQQSRTSASRYLRENPVVDISPVNARNYLPSSPDLEGIFSGFRPDDRTA